MDPKISLITLGVSDLNRSRRFYESGLGLKPRPEGSDGVAFYEMSGTWLALFPRDELAKDAGVAAEGSGFPAFSIAHNVTSKAAVDALIGEAVKAGGTLVKKAEDAFWGGYSGYFADPDGFLWEVAWNPLMPQLASER